MKERMMGVRIIVDSTADTTPEIRECCTVVPLSIFFGETEYVDGVTINHREFYEKLIESDVMPTTSQASPAAFSQVFRETVEAGDQAVVITVASGLSGTFQSASIAAIDFQEDVFVVDSKNVAIATGILAEYALHLRSRGMSAEQIAEELEGERENICIIAMLDTLEYLKRGGRISKTVAFAGELLSIKPVVTVRDGEIIILGKARGSRQANNLLIKEIQNAGGVDFSRPLMLGYTGISDALLQKYIQDSASLWEGNVEKLNSAIIGSVIGTHAGPGAIAVAFFKNK